MLNSLCEKFLQFCQCVKVLSIFSKRVPHPMEKTTAIMAGLRWKINIIKIVKAKVYFLKYVTYSVLYRLKTKPCVWTIKEKHFTRVSSGAVLHFAKLFIQICRVFSFDGFHYEVTGGILTPETGFSSTKFVWCSIYSGNATIKINNFIRGLPYCQLLWPRVPCWFFLQSRVEKLLAWLRVWTHNLKS